MPRWHLATASMWAFPALAVAANGEGSSGENFRNGLVGLVGVVAIVAAWWAGRHAGKKSAAEKTPHLQSLLEFADCLLWQAEVQMREKDWLWTFSLQDTGLSRRLFPDRMEIVNRLWKQFDVPEQAEMDARCRGALTGGLHGYEQQFHVRKGSRVIWLRESVSITPLGGNRFSLVGLVTDITSQREAELAKRASEERLRQLLGRADCMLWQANVTEHADGRLEWEWFIPESVLYRRMCGGRVNSPRMPWDSARVPEFTEIEARSRQAMRDGRAGYEQEFRVILDAEVVWLHEQVTVRVNGPKQWTLEGVIIDITGQRRAEEARHASEAQLQRVMESAEFLLWHARVLQMADGRLNWALKVPGSRLYRRLFGRDPAEPVVLPWHEVVSAEVYHQMVEHAHGHLLSGSERYEQDIRTEHAGVHFWLHEQATIQRLGPGEWQLVGIVTDATAEHEAELARQASERSLREILERADCLLWRATVRRPADNGPLEWHRFDLPASRLCLELLGRERVEPSDQLWDSARVPDLADMNACCRAAIDSGAPGYEQEFRALRDDRTFWLHERVTILPVNTHEWRLVGVVTNVTERHQAQEAHRQSEARLEELLHRADCMIWQGQVTRAADGPWQWEIYSPRSRLHRRIFGRDPDGRGFAWRELGVPEFDAMCRLANSAMDRGEPGYHQVFHIPNTAGDLWVTEQVTINRTSENHWDVVGVITDITERHEAEEARRKTEAQLKQILELAECMVWEATVTDQADGTLDWKFYTTRSVLYRRIFGDEQTDMRLRWTQLNVPEMAEIQERSREAIRRGAPGYEQAFRVLQGERVIWLREVVTISPIRTGQSRLVGVLTDITAQREAQEAHKATEAQLEQMLATADCLLWQARVFAISPERLKWVLFLPRSRLYREIFGVDPGQPAKLSWSNVVDATTREEIDRRAAAAVRNGASGYEQEFRAQRGERVFWLHEQVAIAAVGPGEWKLVGVITDLTARREAEQAVRASELRYRTLYQHTPVAIVQADFSEVGRWLEGLRLGGITDLAAFFEADPRRVDEGAKRVRFLDCNDTAMTVFRAKAKSEFRRRRSVLATPEAMQMIKQAMFSLWEGGNTLQAEIPLRDFESRLHDMHVRWWMERGDTGLDLRQSVMVFVDLTELKQAEAALAAEKERLAVTLRAMAEGVITTDIEGRVQFINPAAAVFTQCPGDSAIGRAVGEVCRFENDRTGEKVEVPVPRVAQGDVVIDLPARTKLVPPEGPSRLVEGCCAPIHSSTSKVIGTVLVFRDVTEHERLEQELVRATKLESVGILAGGIAHDFNNILTAVMGNVALAALDVDPQSEAGRSLREAERATLRARDLTQQLLTFAKGGEPVRSTVLLDGIVREMTTFTLHGSRVKAIYEVPPDLWPADADKAQIGRVVQNLVLNAVQAMPEGGTVRIRLSNQEVDGLSRLALAPGEYVEIAISDTGTGIKPQHLPRIFDPYFTTKTMGSGLGLAAVYSIVNKHRGLIDVESQLGKGTTFRIWLPASRGAPAPDQVTGVAVKPVPLRGRVLFMDDEEAIRQMAGFLLRRFGFEVVCAADGAEAVETFRLAMERREPFALVIMDLTVPGGMGGREAVGRLREIDPQVRAIVSSGYSSDPVLANYREHGFCGVAAKPYEVADLARVLREALGGSATPWK